VKHLFLAANSAGFGEISVGLRIARDLAARGDEVVFLSPRDAGVLFEGTPFRHVAIDDAFWTLEPFIKKMAAREGAGSVVLIDVTTNLLAFETLCVGSEFLERLDLPVVAFDIWNLPHTGLDWDLGSETLNIPPLALRFQRRIVSVPFNRPGVKGAFDALPHLVPPAADEVARLRAEIGVPPEGRLLLVATSRFQLPEMQVRKSGRRMAQQLPERVAALLAPLGGSVHLAHVGPAAFEAWSTFGSRYHWLGQVGAGRFTTLLGAADLLLSFNTTASSAIAALDLSLPVVACVNSVEAKTVEEAAAALGRPLTDALREWLGRMVPMYPFHAWGLGLFRFYSKVLEDNPYAGLFRSVEILDEEALLEECHALLFDAGRREAARERQAAYRRLVSGLPSPADALMACL
jgi:hypothetical protein